MQSIILQNIAIYYGNKGESEKSMKVLIEEAIPMSKKANNNVMLGSLYKTIGNKIMLDGNHKKANYYYQKALEQFNSNNNNSLIFKEEKLSVQIYAAENLLELNKPAQAKKLLDEVYFQLKSNTKSNINNQYYYSIGYYYFKIKDYKKSINYYDKGINLLLSKNNPASIRLQLGKYDALFALKEYQKAYEVIKDISKLDYISIDEKIVCYLELSKTLDELGRYKDASHYAQEYIRVNDSLVRQNSNSEILNLEAKFKNTESQNKIKQLQIQKQKAQLLAQNNNLKYTIFGIISVALLILVVFIYAYFKNKIKLSQAIDLKNKQQITTLKTQKELEVMQAMINGEEAERKRLARDLHDGIGSRLSALKMQLYNSITNKKEAIENDYFYEMLNNAITELRQIAFNLMPETLIKLGLELALKDLCHSLESEKTAIIFQSSKIDEKIAETNQIAIFRIIQELINNALKHANCSEIIIDCNQNENIFLITVEDNGVGIDLNEIKNFSGLGLKNIKSRVDLLKGKLEIKNSISAGSITNIELCLES
jgi:two-component system, NarL family, sensor kinase